MVGFTTGFGTAPPATGGSEAGPRGEGGIYQHFGTAPPATCGSEVFPRAEASPNQPQPVSILYPCRSSARGPLPQVPQGHPGVAMGAPGRVFVHEMSLSHGHRAPNPVFVHEMSLTHGRRGPNRVFVHEMSLSHGHRAPDQPHHSAERRILRITPSSPGSATSRRRAPPQPYTAS